MLRTRRLVLALLLGLGLGSPAALGATLGGTVTTVGKDRFTIHPERPKPGVDTVTFKLSDNLRKGKVNPREPLYKGKYADMRVGQQIRVEYHRDEKTGELIADGFRILKVKPKEKKPAR
jgi:hypothetical protein